MKDKIVVEEDGKEVRVEFYSFIDIPDFGELIGTDGSVTLTMGIS